MTPAVWTLTDWAWACATIAVVGLLGQWVWNAMLHPILAELFDWKDIEPIQQVPPIAWIGIAALLFVCVAALFIGHAAGLEG